MAFRPFIATSLCLLAGTPTCGFAQTGVSLSAELVDAATVTNFSGYLHGNGHDAEYAAQPMPTLANLISAGYLKDLTNELKSKDSSNRQLVSVFCRVTRNASCGIPWSRMIKHPQN